MKKLLIISYDFPPRGSVGMVRVLRFIKYLKRSGYHITVATAEEKSRGEIVMMQNSNETEGVDVVRIPSEAKSGFFLKIIEKIFKLDIGWFMNATNDLPGMINIKDFDAIISTSPPESAHMIAAFLKKHTKAPWIADLRDLWSLDHYRDYNFIVRRIMAVIEKSTLRPAHRIAVVSEAYAEKLKGIYGNRVRLLTNAYDDDKFKAISVERDPVFRISYLGKLNSKHQDLRVFVSALKEIISGNIIPRENIQAEFYISGHNKPDIDAMARENSLAGVMAERSPVSIDQAYEIMKRSSVLLLAGWSGISSEGWRSQKVYEYLGSGTPILFINGEGNRELANLLDETGRGRHCPTVGQAKEFIVKTYEQYRSKKTAQRDDALVRQYSATEVVKTLISMIEGED